MRRHYSKVTLAMALAGLVLSTRSVSAQLPLLHTDQWNPTETHGPIVYGPKAKDGGRAAEYCDKAVGKRVQVEGIAWGTPSAAEGRRSLLSPPESPRVIFEEGAIYVQGVDFTKAKVHGKLVRIGGAIEPYDELNARIEAYYKRPELDIDKYELHRSLTATRHGLRGYFPRRRPPPKYFYINITSLEIVAEVVEPKIVLRPPEE